MNDQKDEGPKLRVPKSQNINWEMSPVGAEAREALLGQKGHVLWFTGLSGSGKSTLTKGLDARLVAGGRLSYVLDGDNVRHGLNRDLGFDPEDRHENLRRIAEVGSLFAGLGAITMTAFISPYREDRQRAKKIVGEDRFVEIFVDTPLEECERRDKKGLYAKARAGEIKNFTGLDAPYEAPLKPDFTINTEGQDIEASLDAILEFLINRGIVPSLNTGRTL